MNNDYNYNYDSSNGGMPPVDLTPNQNNGSGYAVASLILGISSIGLGFFGCCCINLIPAILSIIFAIVSKKKGGKMSGMATAGIILSIIAIVITILFFGVCFWIGIEMVTNPDNELVVRFKELYEQYTGVSFDEIIAEVQAGDLD